MLFRSTIVVPSGKGILFRVKAAGSGSTYDYAGQVVTDLAPGESRLLAIPMRAAIHIGGRTSSSACFWQNGARVNLLGTSGEVTAITVGNLYKLPFAYCLTSYSVPNSKLTRGVSANTFHH
mgnify:CR=1 FL=1